VHRSVDWSLLPLAVNKMRRLLASKLSHTVEFQLATLGDNGGGEA